MKEKLCEFSEKLISYLYREEIEDASIIEEHISSCKLCAEELSAFEILREDLAFLRSEAEKEFQPVNLALETKNSHWAELIKAIQAFLTPKPLAIASALIAVFIGLGYLLIVSKPENTISDIGETTINVARNDNRDSREEKTDEILAVETQEVKKVKASESSKRDESSKTTAKPEKRTFKKQQPDVRTKKKNDDLELIPQTEVDEGLRLADLFEEIGEV